MIRIALPKSRLWKESCLLLQLLGMPMDTSDRRYVCSHPRARLEAVLLKIPDIPRAVADGWVDFAVACDEWLAEDDGPWIPMTPLCWYHLRMCVLAPEGGPETASRTFARPGRPLTVATSYPVTTSRLLGADGPVEVRSVAGAAEAYPGRMTDVAVDCVETGGTARANGLAIVRDLMRCDVRLVRSVSTDPSHPAARMVIDAVKTLAVDQACSFGQVRPPARSLR